jgi:8-oxo-dGTP pyrophosphatase MutT (NUDIX family)
MYPCSGFVILNYKDEIAVVTTPKGYCSFPKGKLHAEEKYIETAYRETQEETGILKGDIDVIDGVTFEEKSKKGNPSVIYFIGKLNIGYKEIYPENPAELSEAKWVNINSLKKLNFREPRMKIVSKIIKYISKNKISNIS